MTNPEPPKIEPIRGAERRETRALSEEKRAQALELFKHGIGYTKASRILNISVNTVRDWSRDFKRGTFRTEISENQYRYPQEIREHVIRLRLSGHSWSEIRNATEISSSTARKWIDSHCRKPGPKEQIFSIKNKQ